MTPVEINEAVARKLGWTIDDSGLTIRCRPPSHLWLSPCDKVPDYCHSIAAAWEICEYLQKEHYLFSIDFEPLSELPWRVTLVSIERDEAAPMAICLAFLKLEDV